MFEQGSAADAAATADAAEAADPADAAGVIADPWAGEMAQVAPVLVGALAASEASLADLDAADVVRVAGAAQRIMNWALSVQLRAVGELHARYCMPDPGVRQAGSDRMRRLAKDFAPGMVADDIALGCRISEYAAADRLNLALALDEWLPVTRAAAGRGELDWVGLKAVVDAIGQGTGIAQDVAAAVEARVIPDLTGRVQPDGTVADPRILNPSMLRKALKRAVIAVDPAAADRRAVAARRSRRVWFTPEADGMASLWLTAPAEAMLQVQRRLKVAMAASDRAARVGDSRTFEQREADTLIDLILNPADHPAAGGPCGCPTGASIDVGSGGGGRNGSGRRTHRPVPEVVLTVPLSAVLAHPPGPTHGPGSAGSADGPGAVDEADWTDRVGAEWQATSIPTDAVPELVGYGPVPPAMARDIAERGAWRCAVVDDEHGTLLGLGSRTFTPEYRPGAPLQRFVRLRDRTCQVPGCQARADLADEDHRIAHPAGATCECNLQALCRRHHGRKHRGSLHAEVSQNPKDPPGTLTWTTSAGLTYRQPPTALPRTRPEGLAESPAESPEVPGAPAAVPEPAAAQATEYDATVRAVQYDATGQTTWYHPTPEALTLAMAVAGAGDDP